MRYYKLKSQWQVGPQHIALNPDCIRRSTNGGWQRSGRYRGIEHTVPQWMQSTLLPAAASTTFRKLIIALCALDEYKNVQVLSKFLTQEGSSSFSVSSIDRNTFYNCTQVTYCACNRLRSARLLKAQMETQLSLIVNGGWHSWAKGNITVRGGYRWLRWRGCRHVKNSHINALQ